MLYYNALEQKKVEYFSIVELVSCTDYFLKYIYFITTFGGSKIQFFFFWLIKKMTGISIHYPI